VLYYQFNFCEVAEKPAIFEGQIDFGYRLNMRVPLTLLVSPVMFTVDL